MELESIPEQIKIKYFNLDQSTLGLDAVFIALALVVLNYLMQLDVCILICQAQTVSLQQTQLKEYFQEQEDGIIVIGNVLEEN
jgi:hypothetical protein